MMILQKLKGISTRGRVAFSISCLESAISFFQMKNENWDSIINKEFWSFCSSSMGLWVEKVVELLPASVLEECDFKVKDYQYFSEEEHNELKKMYKNTNDAILKLIDLVYEIGYTNVNISLKSEALKLEAMPYLEELINLMNYYNIPLPDMRLFEKFPISENNGWGREFTKEEVYTP